MDSDDVLTAGQPDRGEETQETVESVEPSFPGPSSFDRPASAIYRRFDESFPEPLIDLDLLIAGGPEPDGIPPVDDPKYITVEEATYIPPQESVMVVDIDGDARAYPSTIMIWHEIVNAEVGGIPITISYCPLCNSAVAFERTHADGTVMDFGTSGLLYNSALVMYDRQTATLWTHLDGRAVHGVMVGNELRRVPISTVSFGDFAAAHPEGLVLSLDTGTPRAYGSNPYPGYDNGGSGTLKPADFDDSVAPAMTRVVAVRDGESVAVLHELLASQRVVRFTADGRDLVAWWLSGTASALDQDQVAFGRDVGATGVFVPRVGDVELTFEPVDDGFVDNETGSHWNVLGLADSGELAGERLEAVEHLDTFWFAISAYRTDTRLVGEELLD
ncbi:MAG: DUF3179 domain-containing protein [Actinomycetota bacterium]|nr:DUF3179 domain-containing protein [Actinomycetota bacterium]